MGKAMETAVKPYAPVQEKQPPRKKMTYEEFLEWADEDTWAEWVDGEVIVLTPASTRHQHVADFLNRVMEIYAEYRDLGTVISAPFQMKLERGREPDLLFVAQAHLDRLKENYLDGPADIAVEIVSPESTGRDWREKFYEYERGGVREYWLIDLDRRWAEFYRLGEEERYETVFAGSEGEFRSTVLEGFWLRVEWLWQEPLPDTEATAWEILGYEQVIRRLVQTIGIEEARRLLGEQEPN
jgi:Uma2 family endonuclease